jgi:hypothetical protein
VTSIIETAYDRLFIVRSYTQRVPIGAWAYHRLLDTWVAEIRETPAVEIESVDASGMTVSLAESRPGHGKDWFTTDEPQDVIITFFSGHRRPDEVVSGATGSQINLTSETGLSGLTVTPSLIPGDVQRLAIDLGTEMLRSSAEGTRGMQRRIQNVGSQMATIEAVDTGYQDRILKRLRPKYRRLV